MSDSEIMAWMEQKTDGLYQTMRDSMNVANDRADLESQLGDLQGLLADTKNGTATPAQVLAKLNQLLAKSQQFPEVAQMLQPMHDALVQRFQQAASDAAMYNAQHKDDAGFVPKKPGAVGITSAEADTWAGQLKDKVDYLGKQDQLGLINIQDVNSQINQTKEIASNLIDSENKSASAVVANIRA
jgi:hypothetical protein